MIELYKLNNTVKHYPWGSPDCLPRFLGQDNPSGEPWAELWMGVHPGGPSTTSAGGRTVSLRELTDLPFLLKFLAAGTPLSIQAHPNREQAREGFERENKAGPGLSAPERNYRDPSHKPEILCALTPFRAMAGFRDSAETDRLLSMVAGTGRLRSALAGGSYGEFLSLLFTLDEEERKSLTGGILRAAWPGGSGPDAAALDLCGELARMYPGDSGILAPLYLNVLDLEPLDAIFIPAGILHAYVKGFALECMANSDNVLRGGLTSKHIDPGELLSVLRFEPFRPERLKPLPVSPGCYAYPALCDEFALYLCRGPEAELETPGRGIIAVSEGRARIYGVNPGGSGPETAGISLGRGESAFTGRRGPGERILFSGDFTLFAALVPGS
ncbi:MAG: mannose-6-phosphate isomerase, class I [Treponema sp.]|jgi:mannose-6-phosphate isomerase|nr:mannose-6-phosphate isomerase, class I [Treponema sp.]